MSDGEATTMETTRPPAGASQVGTTASQHTEKKRPEEPRDCSKGAPGGHHPPGTMLNKQYPKNFVRSQEHLLRSSAYNPQPTTMPPPTAGLAGAIGERHVICFCGLPARGKQFMAERLCRYLKFFHGAQCKIFDLASPAFGSDESVGDALSAYLEEEDETATTQLLRSLEGIDDDSLDRLKKNVDSGKIAILDTSDAFRTQRRAWSGTSKETRWAMQKHLASLRVRVKLLFIEVVVTDTTLVRRFLRQRLSAAADGAQSHRPHAEQSSESIVRRKPSTSSCDDDDFNDSSKGRRRSSRGDGALEPGAAPQTVAASSMTQDSQQHANVVLLEAKISKALARIGEFGRAYVTIQDDGSEDDLAYVKLINYGEKVVTNRIRGFLLMQIVKYLSHVHPNPRTVYLSRHGQSQYNVCQKIGGNPGLTESGERYSKWLGSWVPANIWPAESSTLFQRHFQTPQGSSNSPPAFPERARSGTVDDDVDDDAATTTMTTIGGTNSSANEDAVRSIDANRPADDDAGEDMDASGSSFHSTSSVPRAQNTLQKNGHVACRKHSDAASSSSSAAAHKLAAPDRSYLASEACGVSEPDDEAVDPATGRPLFGRVFNVYDVATKTSRPAIIRPARLWTSTMKRTIDTARHIPHPVLELRGGGAWHQMLPRVYRNLDELFAGDYEGMTYDEIAEKYGGESILRKKDKLGYRYPRGESYLDLIARLDPLMHELESYTEPLLIVSHQATLRIVYSYLVGLPRADAPKIEIPLHTVIRIDWDGWNSLSETRYEYVEPQHGDDEHGGRGLQVADDGQAFL